MLIQKDERLSRGAPSQRPEWDAGPRRVPRNWFKIVRSVLYMLIGLLAGIAALAAVALFLDSGTPRPAQPLPAPGADAGTTTPPPDALSGTLAPTPAMPPPETPAPPAVPPAIPPPAAGPPPAAPGAAPAAVLPSPAAPSPSTAAEPDAGAVAALQQQLHEAASALSGLRSETEALRKALLETRQRQMAETAPRPAATPPAAPATRPAAAPAPAPAPAPSSALATPAPADSGAAWADAERTIRALDRHAEPDAAAPPAAAASVPPPAAAPSPATELAVNAPLAAPAPAAPRPRVFLHYPAGSPGGMHAATDIAQRLLFSDFAYADTRSTMKPTSDSVIRYFYPEDAQAAERLAALLSDGGATFRVQDASDRRGRARPGMLDVWIGR